MKNYKTHIFLLFLFFSTLLSSSDDLNLGRDKDPKTIEDIGKLKLLYKKTFWSTLSILGPRNVTKLVYPKAITYMEADNAVAFTIDDGFCGADNPDGL